MNSDVKYKKLLFKFIYWYLRFEKIENNFRKQGVLELKRHNEEFFKESTYFSLLNEVDLSTLSKEELEYLDKIDINTVNVQDIVNFILSTYHKVLFNNRDSEYTYYGIVSDQYKIPSDCVALGFHYDKYGLACGNRLTLEQINSNEKIVCDTLNYLQFNVDPKIKIAFVVYNELYNKVPDRFMK